MPSTLSVAAKAKVAAGIPVVLAGITAWQIATRGGFSWWDLIPIIAAIAGTACTDHVENTLTRPAAKAVVHGSLSGVAAVAAALAALVGPEPAGVSLTKLVAVGLGSALVWYMPEAAPAVRVVEGALMGPDVPVQPATAPVAAPQAPPAPPVVSTPRQADSVPSSAYILRDIPAPAAAPVSEPTPIHDLTAAAAVTAPVPAVPAT